MQRAPGARGTARQAPAGPRVRTELKLADAPGARGRHHLRGAGNCAPGPHRSAVNPSHKTGDFTDPHQPSPTDSGTASQRHRPGTRTAPRPTQ